VAQASFPNGNPYMRMRDVLGTVYHDESFAALFATRGRPAEAPWRLALVTVMQFAEGLSDRQAAEAVRARIDWKYTLSLELTDPGFDFSVLCEFRARLLHGSAAERMLDAFLAACRERGYLRARGRQRTDSTHVLGALRLLSRLECVAETLRQALNSLATAAPDWLRDWTPAEWFERYGRRIEEYRLPKGQAARTQYAETVGRDGLQLLAQLSTSDAPPALRVLPAVEILRRTWLCQYMVIEDQVRLREPKDMPPVAACMDSPYETEARYGAKRGMSWIGYKTHLTETCDDDLPHLLTEVETTIATASDLEQLAAIQGRLATIALLPAQHLVDAGYVRAQNLLASARDHQIDLIGPLPGDHQWQARAKQGFALSQFVVDWDAQTVTCPQGQHSSRWGPTQTSRGPMIHIEFAAADCTPCPVRSCCTRAKTVPRSLTLQPKAEYLAIQAARERRATDSFAAQYAPRAGVEGTLSQAVRAFGLRHARYRGLAKTYLQDVATAAAINLSRLCNWLDGIPRAQTRRSRFAALATTS
jgi:transposase